MNNPTIDPATVAGTPVKVTRTTYQLVWEVAPFKRGAAKDTEVDIPASKIGTLTEGYYIGDFITKPTNSAAGFARGFKNLAEVDQATYDQAVLERSQYMQDNPELAFAPGVTPFANPKAAKAPAAPKPPKQPKAQPAIVTVPEANPEAVAEALTEIEQGVAPKLSAFLPAQQPKDEVVLPAGWNVVKGVAQPKEYELLAVPEKDPGYIEVNDAFGKPVFQQFDNALQYAKDTGQPVNILISGDTGGGKSMSPEQWAASRGLLFMSTDCSGINDPSQFLGMIGLEQRNGASVTVYKPTPLVEGMQDPRWKVILLDELNRVVNPIASNAIFPLLDHRRRVIVPEANLMVKVDPHTIFIATINGPVKGSNSEKYMNTTPLDEALASRWTWRIVMNYPDESTLLKILRKGSKISSPDAKKIARVAKMLAGDGYHFPNMRELQLAARLTAYGYNLWDSLHMVFGALYPDEGVDSLYTTFKSVLEGQQIRPDTKLEADTPEEEIEDSTQTVQPANAGPSVLLCADCGQYPVDFDGSCTDPTKSCTNSTQF